MASLGFSTAHMHVGYRCCYLAVTCVRAGICVILLLLLIRCNVGAVVFNVECMMSLSLLLLCNNLVLACKINKNQINYMHDSNKCVSFD